MRELFRVAIESKGVVGFVSQKSLLDCRAAAKPRAELADSAPTQRTAKVLLFYAPESFRNTCKSLATCRYSRTARCRFRRAVVSYR